MACILQSIYSGIYSTDPQNLDIEKLVPMAIRSIVSSNKIRPRFDLVRDSLGTRQLNAHTLSEEHSSL